MKAGRSFRARSGFGSTLGAAFVALALAVSAQDADPVASAVVKIVDTPRPGTGVVVVLDQGVATVLTASHVIQGAREFRVVFAAAPDRLPIVIRAEDLVGMETDETHGLAAFRVRGVPQGVQPAPIEERADLKSGEPLAYRGYPNNANTMRFVGGNFSGLDGRLLIMDRSVGQGASGGPVSRSGRIVGIATAMDAQSTFAVVADVVAVALRGWGVRLPASNTVVSSPAKVTPSGGSASPSNRLVGEVFRDCADCPEMVVIPAGRFTMGSPSSQDPRETEEGPTRVVSVPSFALGRYEVTRTQFETYVADVGALINGCQIFNGTMAVNDASSSWRSPGFDQSPSEPVVCVNWNDADAFVAWLRMRTKQPYRLASEAEWEYAARARTTTSNYWGERPSSTCAYANVADEAFRRSFPMWNLDIHPCADGFTFTAPVGQFRPNAFGLYDMLGNASEWTQDCWNDDYTRAPTNGGAWTTGDCNQRVLRGLAWINRPVVVRSAFRNRDTSSQRDSRYGIRVARALP
jgi:formylglycine-generating enzyme required for sulfatase activity